MSEKVMITEIERFGIINELANVRKEFERRVKESGRTPQMFIVMDTTGYATETLYKWDQVTKFFKDNEIEIDIEPLVPGVEINEVEPEDGE